MPTPRESTKGSLRWKLLDRARTRWPQLSTIHIRFRSNFAYADGVLTDGTVIPLIRLRYGGSHHGRAAALQPAR